MILQAVDTSVLVNVTIVNATDVAAWLGAITGAFALIFQLYQHVSNRARIKFRVSSDLEIVGTTLDGRVVHPHGTDTFWSVTVSNVGSKDVTINQICFDHNNSNRSSLLTKDLSGPISPYVLTPGNSHSYTIAETLSQYKNIKRIILIDATGKKYKKHISHTREKLKDTVHQLKSKFF